MAEEKEGWTFFLFIICVAVTIGAVIPIGYCFGVLNAPAQFIKMWALQSASSRYSMQLTKSQLTLVWASIVSMFQIGGIVGSLFASYCNKRLGRRGTLQLSGIIFFVAGLLHFFCRSANSLEMLLLGRFLGGVAAALVYSTQPMYLVELAPPELSGSVGVFTCIGVTGGIVVGQIFSFDFFWGNNPYWHWALAGYVFFVIIGLLPLCLFPESPRYLMSKGEQEKTKAALLQLRKSPERANKELAEIEAANKLAVETMSMKAVILDGKLLMPLIIVCSFHIVQQGSGCNAIWYYSVGIFTDAGFSVTVALWLNFMEGSLNFIVALFGPILMSKFNRRTMMMISCLFSGIFMALLSFGLASMVHLQWLSYPCIFFLSMYIVFFNMGLGPMPYFIGAELFLVSPRAAAMAMGSLSNWLTNFIIGMIFPILDSAIGSFAFLPFTFVCIYGLLITYRYLPETRNHNPEEVAPLLEHGFKSKIKPSA